MADSRSSRGSWPVSADTGSARGTCAASGMVSVGSQAYDPARVLLEESMAPHRRLSIVILYCHPLLGEGIGRLLAREPRAAVTYVDCADADGVVSAAAALPDMVVVERGGAIDAIGVMRQFP